MSQALLAFLPVTPPVSNRAKPKMSFSKYRQLPSSNLPKLLFLFPRNTRVYSNQGGSLTLIFNELTSQVCFPTFSAQKGAKIKQFSDFQLIKTRWKVSFILSGI